MQSQKKEQRQNNIFSPFSFGFFCGIAACILIVAIIAILAISLNLVNPIQIAGSCTQGIIDFAGFGAGASCNLVQPVFAPGASDEIVSLIRSAKYSIDIEMYVLTDKELAQELAAAAQRGVRVRVLLEPRVESSSINSISKALDAGGVEVRWASTRFALTHAKMMIIDGKKALVGSINFSKAAQNKNREVDVLISGPVLDELKKTFENDWEIATPLNE
jgi:phosphatidylserine/phosphatidylglycerophosphate/cardiolipin synthase-like enzyme